MPTSSTHCRGLTFMKGVKNLDLKNLKNNASKASRLTLNRNQIGSDTEYKSEARFPRPRQPRRCCCSHRGDHRAAHTIAPTTACAGCRPPGKPLSIIVAAIAICSTTIAKS